METKVVKLTHNSIHFSIAQNAIHYCRSIFLKMLPHLSKLLLTELAEQDVVADRQLERRQLDAHLAGGPGGDVDFRTGDRLAGLVGRADAEGQGGLAGRIDRRRWRSE